MAKHEKKVEKTKNIKKVVIIISLICVAAVIFSTIIYLYYSFRHNSYVEDNKENLSSYEQNGEGDYKEVDGITNVLLLGSDARNLDEQSRADAILILSIDNIHKKLKLVSIMRDSYVKIPGHGEQKINHAYALGGPELLMATIEENFKIKLDRYSIINFNGFQQLIDSIGGLDLDVSKSEMNEMNKFIPEVNPKDPHLVKEPGFQHLDGQQVLSYARIRKIGNGDYDRTQRQREVVSAIIDKLKDTNILKYPVVVSKLFPYVKTNMEVGQILNYAYTVYKINNFTPEQILIPVPEITDSKILKNKGWVLLMDINQTAEIIHDFIFEDKMYDIKDLDFALFKKAMEKYREEISTNPKDAEENEPIYNKEDVINDKSKEKINNQEEEGTQGKENGNESENREEQNNTSDNQGNDNIETEKDSSKETEGSSEDKNNQEDMNEEIEGGKDATNPSEETEQQEKNLIDLNNENSSNVKPIDNPKGKDRNP
ncbi:LytR family transcriptional regulator [Clostridium bovifaecis]|uniref:LytR family transcriptional regulator n=1 Tax=Clostridium bovifaecis TaxID=2184719 RepID=A0A6I6F9A2_9CLOT|nr:LytR family transcriptional regulator [Clostridium bovifaecis]